MIHLTIYKIVGRSYLKNDYLSSFIQFENCCAISWCCKRLEQILDEFEKKGFNTFNLHVECWKVYQDVNFFKIDPIFETLRIFFLFFRKNGKFGINKYSIKIYKT